MNPTFTSTPLYYSRGGIWNGTGSGPQGGRGVVGGGGQNQPTYICTPFLTSGRRSMVSTSTPPPLYHSRGGFWNGTSSGPQGGRGVVGGGGPNQLTYTCTPFLNSGRRSMVSTSTPPPLSHSRGGFWNGTGSGPQGGRGVVGGGGPNQPTYTCTPFLNSGRRSVHSTFSVPPVSHSLVFGGPLTGPGSGPQGGGGIARGGGPTLPTHTITPFLTSGNQRSPSNPEEKKKYERDFLLLLQNNPESIKKPENLPDIVLKVSTKRQQELNAAMRGILNKLTPQNFEKLVNQVLKLPIDTMDKLVGVINLVFDKAVDEPHFSVVYAELCNYLNNANIVRQVSKGEDSNNNNFRKILLKRCQKEFQKDKAAESGLHEREKEIKKKEMRLVMEEDERRMKRKSVGVTRFIGELYKLGMINQSTIVTFIEELLEAGDEESLEQFCIFNTTVGKILEEALQKVATGEPNTPNLHIYFNKIKNIVNERKTSAHVRFMLQYVIDLKNRKWVPRRDKSVPKKLEEINLEAERETMEQNQLTFLHMSRGSMAGGMGRRGDGKHNQWSPSNPEEKKKYERDFLFLLQNNPESIKKPENLPDIVMKVGTKRAHFTIDQFELNRADGIRKLKPNAIPTIFSHRPIKIGRKPPAERSTIVGITISKRRKQQDSNTSCQEFPTPMRDFPVEEIVSTVPQPTTTKYIRKHIADPCHMVEELPEVYTFVTLPHLEQSHLNVQWVYKIFSGEEGQERIIYESPIKDDKDGFLLIKDPRWDGINLDNLHLLAIAYRPGILSLRDLRQHHLSLLKNIYVMGKEVIMEKYDIVGSQLRVFIQYQPSFYHLHVHFTTMNDGICESRFGKAHLLDSVINNIQICPTYYEISLLTFCLKESDDLFEKFEAHGLVKRIQQSN